MQGRTLRPSPPRSVSDAGRARDVSGDQAGTRCLACYSGGGERVRPWHIATPLPHQHSSSHGAVLLAGVARRRHGGRPQRRGDVRYRFSASGSCAVTACGWSNSATGAPSSAASVSSSRSTCQNQRSPTRSTGRSGGRDSPPNRPRRRATGSSRIFRCRRSQVSSGLKTTPRSGAARIPSTP